MGSGVDERGGVDSSDDSDESEEVEESDWGVLDDEIWRWLSGRAQRND